MKFASVFYLRGTHVSGLIDTKLAINLSDLSAMHA